MAEVSCDALDVVFYALGRRGIAAERVIEGTGVTAASLRARSRLSWDAFVSVLERFDALIGGPDAVELAAGEYFDGTPFVNSTVVALVVEPRQLYRIACRFGSGQFVANLESTYSEDPDGTLRIEGIIPERDRDCPTFFRITKAAFHRFPVALGHPPAQVTMTVSPRRARYEVRLSTPRFGRLRRLAWALGLGRMRQRGLDALLEQQRGIQQSMLELRRANELVGEQKRALERSDARWRSLVESAADTIMVLDPAGTVLFVNHVRAGLDVRQLIGRSISALSTPERAPLLLEAVRAAVQDRRTSSWDTEWEGPPGHVGTYNLQISPIVEDGKTTGALLVVRDLTDARKHEEQRLALERRVLEAEKLESLGLLAGGIAHDFNNILAAIVTNAGMAGMVLDPGAPSAPYLERVEAGAMRAAGLVEQLLAYTGRGRFEVRPLDVSALIEDLVQLLAAGLPKSAAIRSSLASGLPAVEGDWAQLQQVVMNLVTNAAEALEGLPGEVTLRTGLVTWPDVGLDEPTPPAELPPGDYVLIEISDTGKGMDEATAARMFEPFFTTKRGGRGLGLAAVQGNVRRHRGALVVRSVPGGGTTFRVFLPASSLSVPPEEEPPSDRTRLEAPGTVLVVDDEAGVREGAGSVLAHHGFQVVHAADGSEALRIFRERGHAITVVLLDKTMPGLNGAEVFRELRRIRPDARVLMSSAYDAGDVATGLAAEGLRGFLRKPYRAETLVEAIRRAAR